MPIVAALSLLVCLACGPGGPNAPAPVSSDSAFVAALRARLDAATEAGEFSGAVLVARDGHTLFEGAYGSPIVSGASRTRRSRSSASGR